MISTGNLRGAALLRLVKQRILEEPKRIEMSMWRVDRLEDDPDYHACRTMGCIAGWLVMLSGTDRHGLTYEEQGARLLGVDRETAKKLFYPANWPPHMHDEYTDGCREDYPAMRARATCKAIDWFIERYMMPKKPRVCGSVRGRTADRMAAHRKIRSTPRLSLRGRTS